MVSLVLFFKTQIAFLVENIQSDFELFSYQFESPQIWFLKNSTQKWPKKAGSKKLGFQFHPFVWRPVPGSYLRDLCEDADRDNSGTISAEEFLKALVMGKVAFNYLRESLNKGIKEMKQNECDPWILLIWLFLFDQKASWVSLLFVALFFEQKIGCWVKKG